MDIQADGVGNSVFTRVTIVWEESAIGVVSSAHKHKKNLKMLQQIAQNITMQDKKYSYKCRQRLNSC